MHRRVLDGLPRLLSMGSKSLPAQVQFINGIIKGLADSHIGKMPEEELYNQLTWIIREITQWRDGDVAESVVGPQVPTVQE